MNTHFYPERFFWKDQDNDHKKIQTICKVLNELSEEQAQAVEYFASSLVRQENWDIHSNN